VDSGDNTGEYYVDADSAKSGDTDEDGVSVLQTIVDSSSSETLKFYWKVSCEQYTDYLEFYIDGNLQNGRITGDTEWAQQTHTVSSGVHTLKWVYKDYGGSHGENRGWVDFVQWTGYSPVPDSNDWQEIEYKHDVAGRRSEKIVDGYATRYVYDGSHVIAEYDGNNNLLRKYVYGPGIDQPVSMIEVADSNAAYYYHYDALGSVIALSDSSGDTVQTYEYSVFGEPAVEDANHTNPYMFAGRRYDVEIGLYYNRARYYNPYTGRFLQTDPSGYSDGMNWYVYCGNNPAGRSDPSGLRWVGPNKELWQQDMLMSCVPASFVNMAKRMGYRGVSDKLELDFRKRFEEALGKPRERSLYEDYRDQNGSLDSVWGAGGTGVSMETALKVWNAWLDEVDTRKTLPRYELLEGDDPETEELEGWGNDVDTAVERIAYWPVMFGINITGHYHVPGQEGSVELAPIDNIWHANAVWLPKPRDTDYPYRLADPMYQGLTTITSDTLTHIWSNQGSYLRAILVPVGPQSESEE